MFKRILAATDGSDHAQRALVVAGNLASRYDAELLVLNVFSGTEMSDAIRHFAEIEHLKPAHRQEHVSDHGIGGTAGIPLTPIEETEDPGGMFQAARKIGQMIAGDGANSAREAGASKVTPLAREGDPAEVILDAAKEHEIDLIVLGSRGLGTLSGLLIGSVSSKVNNLSECCCITVK